MRTRTVRKPRSCARGGGGTRIGAGAKAGSKDAAVRGGAYFFDLRPNPAGERNGFVMELRRKSSGFRCARG